MSVKRNILLQTLFILNHFNFTIVQTYGCKSIFLHATICGHYATLVFFGCDIQNSIV